MASDLWRTPQKVFDTLNKEFNFCADMAADQYNTKCTVFFDERENALLYDWYGTISFIYPSNDISYVWVNPPYSNPRPWIECAITAQSAGLGVVMLLNQDTSTGWFSRAVEFVSEIRFIIGDEKDECKYSSGRIDFLNEKNEPVKQNNKPQFILIFDPLKIGAKKTNYITKKQLYGEVE